MIALEAPWHVMNDLLLHCSQNMCQTSAERLNPAVMRAYLSILTERTWWYSGDLSMTPSQHVWTVMCETEAEAVTLKLTDFKRFLDLVNKS